MEGKTVSNPIREYVSDRVFDGKRPLSPAAVEQLKKKRMKMKDYGPIPAHCRSCGTVTYFGGACDCTEMGIPETQDLKPYDAETMEEIVRLSKEVDELRYEKQLHIQRIIDLVEMNDRLTKDGTDT
jgi:hypothetical protein